MVTMLICAGANISITRVLGDTRRSTEDLCEGREELLQALNMEWSPEKHHLLPAEVKSSVDSVLAITRRQLPICPLFILCTGTAEEAPLAEVAELAEEPV